MFSATDTRTIFDKTGYLITSSDNTFSTRLKEVAKKTLTDKEEPSILIPNYTSNGRWKWSLIGELVEKEFSRMNNDKWHQYISLYLDYYSTTDLRHLVIQSTKKLILEAVGSRLDLDVYELRNNRPVKGFNLSVLADIERHINDVSFSVYAMSLPEPNKLKTRWAKTSTVYQLSQLLAADAGRKCGIEDIIFE